MAKEIMDLTGMEPTDFALYNTNKVKAWKVSLRKQIWHKQARGD